MSLQLTELSVHWSGGASCNRDRTQRHWGQEGLLVEQIEFVAFKGKIKIVE
jgi:hypothetical protein